MCSMLWTLWRTKNSWKSSSLVSVMVTYNIICTTGNVRTWSPLRSVLQRWLYFDLFFLIRVKFAEKKGSTSLLLLYVWRWKLFLQDIWIPFFGANVIFLWIPLDTFDGLKTGTTSFFSFFGIFTVKLKFVPCQTIQGSIKPLSPKIWLLILSSSSHTSPCK